MKAVKKNSALDGIKKEQLKRRMFTLEFKAEVVRHKKAENLSLTECGRKFEILHVCLTAGLGIAVSSECIAEPSPARKWLD